jgi:hypothetical protein
MEDKFSEDNPKYGMPPLNDYDRRKELQEADLLPAYSHFSQLNPAEQERLTLLYEEASEVIKEVAKIQRHGFESRNPDNPMANTNRQNLAIEIGQLQFIINVLKERGDVDGKLVDHVAKERHLSINRYLHHNKFRA